MLLFQQCWFFQLFGFEHHPAERRLYIDSNKTSLRTVLLHNGNKKPSLLCSAGLNKYYASIETILRLIKYSQFQWNICGHLEVVYLPLGIQMGYVKYQCFLFHWDIKDDKQHYYQTE